MLIDGFLIEDVFQIALRLIYGAAQVPEFVAIFRNGRVDLFVLRVR